MTTRAKWINNTLTWYDDGQSYETVGKLAPVQFYDDFLHGFTVIPAAASSESGMRWVKKIVGVAPPTVAGVADEANGVIACTLTVDSQKQDAGLYMDDQRQFDVTKGLVFEARIKASVLPTLLSEVVVGLIDNWSDGLPDSATYQICFNMDGTGLIRCQSDDNVTDRDVTSGITATNAQWKVLRIDCTTITSVKFFIDGVSVATGTTFPYAATGANAILQPYVGVYKASGAGLGTVQVDYIRIWQNRA